MDKWTNVSAGPRQIKDLQKALGRLNGEGKSHDELYGVVGGQEHSSTLMNLMGPVRAEVVALDQAIREKHGYQITRENVRAIIAEYDAALPEARKSRPTEDNRRTPEEDSELRAKTAEREAGYRAKEDAQNALLAQVMAKAPNGAKALIVAEYCVDASDVQTDYFASHAVRTVAIGFRFSAREDFRALHSAAAQFPETANETFTEHRENYSMGSGNYLSDHGGARAGTGWIIRSRTLPCTWVGLTEDAIPENLTAPSVTESAGGITVSPSSIGREGVVEIRFAEKPAEEVIADLKARGFRWARGNRCWYGRDTAYAESLVSASV